MSTSGGSGSVAFGLTGSALLAQGSSSPNDIGWSYTPASMAAGGASTLTLNVGANVPTVTYNLTLTASANGSQATTAFALTTTGGEQNTVTAASCSSADVQTAINSATAGATVAVPAGACTWTVPVYINAKRLTLVGAGIGVTTITDNAPNGSAPPEADFANGALIVENASDHNFIDISNFTFIKGVAHQSGGIVNLNGTEGVVAFRVHDVRFLVPSSGSASIFIVGLYGLIDHVTFDITATSGSIHAIEGFGSRPASDVGFTPWTQPSSLGTNRAIIIENSNFNEDVTLAGIEVCIDGFTGVRYVIRHNTFVNCSPGYHGTDSGSYRSGVSAEVYDNTFINNSAIKLRGFTARGGSGVIFNNTYKSTVGWYPYTLQVFRMPGSGAPTSNWQHCDGSLWELGSMDLSTPESRVASLIGHPQQVKFCSANRDLECTSDPMCSTQDARTCSAYLDGATGTGYPCRDQPGRGPAGQVLSPWYEWNNTGTGGAPSFDVFPATTLIQANRDYYNAIGGPQTSPASPFNGITGVGYGPLADRPTTCSVGNTEPADGGHGGVGYFATDVGSQGTLYVCSAPNTWHVFYTPYTYPDPLETSTQ